MPYHKNNPSLLSRIEKLLAMKVVGYAAWLVPPSIPAAAHRISEGRRGKGE